MVDCNACNYSPKWYQADKIAKKKSCELTAQLLDKSFLTFVIHLCANYSGRMDNREGINKAKELLLNKTNFFSEDELDNVEIRWCKIKSKFGSYEFGASGMVPEKNKILLDISVKDFSTEELAILIAHEMKHIKQYNDWGTGKFRCEYMSELASGNGFGMDNDVEKEAYNFQDEVAKLIYNSLHNEL